MERIFAIIENGKVENVIVASPEFIEKLEKQTIEVTEMENRPGPGWLYDGETFSNPTQAKAEEIAPEITPEQQTKQDALKALHAMDAEKIPTGGPELKELLIKLIEATK